MKEKKKTTKENPQPSPKKNQTKNFRHGK